MDLSVISARFRVGSGRLGEVRHAAGIPVGVAGNTGKFAAFMLDSDIPAPLRKGAMVALASWRYADGGRPFPCGRV